MKLSMKMIVVFSAIILLALSILSSYAIKTSVEGSDQYTESRFKNMSATIGRDLDRSVYMMQLTLEEMCKNTSFMSALNQMIRDDTAEQKMGAAATKAALQQLYQSPLVDNYYRVTFFTRDGTFITSRGEREYDIISGSSGAKAAFASLSYLDSADASSAPLLVACHRDALVSRENVYVYSMIQPVMYHDKQLGYLEISNEYSELEKLMNYVDTGDIIVQIFLGDGSLLFSSVSDNIPWPDDVAEGEYTYVETTSGAAYNAIHTSIPSRGISIYIAQYAAVNAQITRSIRAKMIERTLIIMLPAIVLIIFLSMSITKSIRSLTRKVRQMPTEGLLATSSPLPVELTKSVVPQSDQEIYELEQVFNGMMVKLRESAANEIRLHEGTLQAQLKALQAQINPHFIYNTLNIISAKAMDSGNFDIIEICDRFAQLLRYSTDFKTSDSTLAQEIENVGNYLTLAKARYEDNLEFSIDVPEAAGSVIIPRLTLQPIVENALNHGFNGKNALRKLQISGEIANGTLTLEVRDNGTGFSGESMEKICGRIREIEAGNMAIDATGGHIGLTNTCLRLYYYSKGTMHMTIHNDSGAVITLTMPCG